MLSTAKIPRRQCKRGAAPQMQRRTPGGSFGDLALENVRQAGYSRM